MATVATVLVGFLALLHVYILVLEMFLWTKPIGMRTFKRTAEEAASSAVLAANQGVYNGFLAAGLAWGMFYARNHPVSGRHIEIFFVSCVLVAGIYGGLTAARKILFVQAVPALITLVCLHLY